MNKYFEGISGQLYAKNILTKLIETSQIPHALLFQGLEGVGKEFIAMRFAQAINDSPTSENHIAIKQITNLTEPYIKYIFPLPRGKNENDASSPFEKLSPSDIQLIQEELSKKISNPYYKIKIPKAQNIKINSIRDIKKFLSLNYTDIKYRVILISDAHLMNESAQNALLKNLEEPPDGVIFILTTPFPSLLRETIRSRCRVVNFQPLEYTAIKDILLNFFDIENILAESVIPFSGGSISNALLLLDNDFKLLKEKTILILRYSFGRKYHSALNEFSPFITDGDSESVKILIEMIIMWLNDIQRYRYNLSDFGKGGHSFFFEDYIETLEKFNYRFPHIEINQIVSQLNSLISAFKNNVNLNTIILSLIFKLAALTSSKLTT